MHCYTCQRGGRAAPAVAICQGCGAGCCLEHVTERVVPGHGPGMVPMAQPRIEMLCPRCAELREAAFAGASRNRAVRAKRGASAAALPDAAEAVSTVEALLGLERAPESASIPATGWRRLFGRKRG